MTFSCWKYRSPVESAGAAFELDKNMVFVLLSVCADINPVVAIFILLLLMLAAPLTSIFRNVVPNNVDEFIEIPSPAVSRRVRFVSVAVYLAADVSITLNTGREPSNWGAAQNVPPFPSATKTFVDEIFVLSVFLAKTVRRLRKSVSIDLLVAAIYRILLFYIYQVGPPPPPPPEGGHSIVACAFNTVKNNELIGDI